MSGRRQDASKLFDVFGRQLSGIGKMLMCLDKMREGNYTSRIWCIFEAWMLLPFRDPFENTEDLFDHVLILCYITHYPL